MLYKGDCFESGSQINIEETSMQTEIHRKKPEVFNTLKYFFLQQFDSDSDLEKCKIYACMWTKKEQKIEKNFIIDE